MCTGNSIAYAIIQLGLYVNGIKDSSGIAAYLYTESNGRYTKGCKIVIVCPVLL